MSVTFSHAVDAQDSPVDSLKTLHAADGLEVSLWASEPMVNNPTSMDIDSRGRVWISEGLNYRMQQKQFETLKRVEGADRIKILSDTNGDGKADTEVVFAEDLFPVPLGLAVEEIWKDGMQTGTRVYIGKSPDLLVLEDTDGDDKADRRYPLLTGFRGIDSDHGLHGMSFGPDGKLYFTVGDARYGADKVQGREKTFDVVDKSGRRISSANFGTTLRVNRDGTQLELLTSGHRNNYEAAVDSFGNVFVSDNDDDGNRGCRMLWVMKGGEYGYQHPDSTRHWAEELPGIIPKLVGTGNGAPAGLLVYEGDLLPKEYFGAVLQIDSGTHQVNVHPLHRQGAGFRSDYKVLLNGNDAWFRPVDLAVAPDGSLLVCDWYDAGVGGNRFSDQTTGRIYRVTTSREAKEAASVANPDANRVASKKWDTDDAIRALRSPNATARLAARDVLLAQGAKARTGLLELFQNGRPIDRARALNVLYDLPQTGRGDAVAALGDADARIRETALQLLSHDATSGADPALLHRILALASDDDAGVRRALLLTVRDVPTKVAGEAIRIMTDSWDGRDRYYLEALRSALLNRESPFLQQLFQSLANDAIASGWDGDPIAVPPYYPIGTNDAFLRPGDKLPPSNAASRVAGLAWVLQRSEALPALAKILEHNDSPSVEQASTIALSGIADRSAGELLLQRYLVDTVGEEQKREILRRLGVGLAGQWSRLANEDNLQEVFVAALQDRSQQLTAIQAMARGKLTRFNDPLMTLAADPTSDDSVRAAAITALGNLRHASVQELATRIVDGASGKPSGGPLALAALDAIDSLASDDANELLINIVTDSGMPLDVRRRALQLATATAPGVDRALSIRKEDAFPSDLESELSFLLHNHSDRGVRRIAAAELPIKQSGDGNKIHDVRTILLLQGDAARGRELFQKHPEAVCARCHRVNGEGALVGPDLASIGMKYGGKELLYHIQYPSGAINYNFAAHSFLLDDGRLLNGLVVSREGGQITLGIATGQHVTISADEVEEERPQTVSLMPEGLVANLTPQQLSDLVEYLLTLRQGDAVSSPAR